MKKLKFITAALVLATTFSILSCNKDDDNDSSSTEDCYTCSTANTKYCYTNGDAFYTVTVGNIEPVQIPLQSGVTWSQIKTGLQAACGN